MIWFKKLMLGLLLIACQSASAAECDLSAPVHGCTLTPDGYQIVIGAFGLCTSAPTAPTSSVALDYSNCEILYDKLAEGGQTVELTEVGQELDFTGDFNKPTNGIYTHAILGFGTNIRIKKSVTFSSASTGIDSNAGVYCATSDDYISTCSSTAPTPEYTSDNVADLGSGVYEANFDNGVTAYIIDSDYKLSTSTGNSYAIVAVQTLPTAQVVSDSTTSFQLGINFTEGITLDDGNTSGYGPSGTGTFVPDFRAGPFSINLAVE